MDENNPFREAFNASTIDFLVDQLAKTQNGLDTQKFRRIAIKDLQSLSFGDRARNIVAALEAILPEDFSEASRILVDCLGPEPTKDHLDGFEGFYVMPLCMYVAKHGLVEPETSLNALYEMTKRFTAEGEIRPFLQEHPQLTLAFLEKLTADPSPFARRLASEGTRPRLPLAGRLPQFQKDPSPVIRLLDRLYTDPNLMVRRSVANNINDISKDKPDIAVATLARWKEESPSPELDWMIRHGLRTLIKSGHPGALALMGYHTHGLEVQNWWLSSNELHLGDSLNFSLEVRSTSQKPQNLALNYVIHFMKANGKTRPKVFRLPSKNLEPGQVLSIAKTHKFLPYKNQSFYPGEHFIEITINGVAYVKTRFHLEVN